MPDNIDTRVSTSLDPENLRLSDDYTEENAKFVGCVVNAFNDAYVTLGKIHDARELWASNGAVTKEGAVVIVAREAAKHQERVLRRFDLAARDLAANISHTESELMKPLTEQAGLGTLNTEVRAYVRGLDHKEREAFLKGALERDDTTSLTAVLGGPSYLSGLTELDQAHFTRAYHEKKRPDLVGRLDAMRRFEERLHAARPVLFAQFAKAVGADARTAAFLQQADDRAKAALKIEPTA